MHSVIVEKSTKSNIYISTMVATRTSKRAAFRKAKGRPANTANVMTQERAKQHRKPWVPSKRNFYKFQLFSSFEITHEGGEVVKAFPGSQYVYVLHFLNWYTCNLPALLSCSGNQISPQKK